MRHKIFASYLLSIFHCRRLFLLFAAKQIILNIENNNKAECSASMMIICKKVRRFCLLITHKSELHVSHDKQSENTVNCTTASILSFAFTNINVHAWKWPDNSSTFTCCCSFVCDNFHLLDCEISDCELLEMARIFGSRTW